MEGVWLPVSGVARHNSAPGPVSCNVAAHMATGCGAIRLPRLGGEPKQKEHRVGFCQGRRLTRELRAVIETYLQPCVAKVMQLETDRNKCVCPGFGASSRFLEKSARVMGVRRVTGGYSISGQAGTVCVGSVRCAASLQLRWCAPLRPRATHTWPKHSHAHMRWVGSGKTWKVHGNPEAADSSRRPVQWEPVRWVDERAEELGGITDESNHIDLLIRGSTVEVH